MYARFTCIHSHFVLVCMLAFTLSHSLLGSSLSLAALRSNYPLVHPRSLARAPSLESDSAHSYSLTLVLIRSTLRSSTLATARTHPLDSPLALRASCSSNLARIHPLDSHSLSRASYSLRSLIRSRTHQTSNDMPRTRRPSPPETRRIIRLSDAGSLRWLLGAYGHDERC